MEEQLSYEERLNYVIEKLSSTEIKPVYYPMIATAISRRSIVYNLNNKLFERDIESFINNVKTIEVGELPKGTLNRFYIEEQKIIINSEWFELQNFNSERFYEAFAHECTHAMNFEKNENGKKEDRTFSSEYNDSTLEMFTEGESNDLVYDAPISLLEDEEAKGLKIGGTVAYREITNYIDIIAATFGVKRNELLGEAIKGPEGFQNFLNSNIDIRCPNSDKNKIFEGISRNIGLFHGAISNNNLDVRQENITAAHSKIYAFAEEGLNHRISNLEVDDLESFKKQFAHIKINQKVIKRLIELGASDKLCEQFKEGTSGKYELVNTKLLCIEQILQNDSIKDKQGLIHNLQSMHDIEEITRFIEEKGIPFDPNMDLEDTISLEEIKEYNKSNASIQWDNSEIVEYIEAHKEEIKQTKDKEIIEKQPNKFKIFIAKAILSLNSLFNKIGNFANKIFGKEEQKLLPSGSERFNDGAAAGPIGEEPKSWELSNYGIDKNEFMEESIRIVEEHINREEQEPAIEKTEESHEII